MNERERPFRFGYWPRNIIIMWAYFALLLLAGTALANPTLWIENMKYNYHVRNQILMGVPDLSNQYSGIVIKGNLILQVVQPNVILVDFVNATFASVHQKLFQSWDTPIPDNELDFSNITKILLKTSKILVRDGGIYQVEVDRSLPMWQVNLLKGILSQLQFISSTGPLETTESRRDVYSTYNVMEQSVCGNCKTLYHVIPLYGKLDYRYPYVVPIPSIPRVNYMLVTKNKDYRHCLQLPVYKFALTKNKDWSLQDHYLRRSTYTSMLVSYNKTFETIQSSITKNMVQVRPKLGDFQNSNALTWMKLTLHSLGKISHEPHIPTNLVSAGNLTYVYPPDSEEIWTEPMLSDLKLQSRSSESFESSENDEMKMFDLERSRRSANNKKWRQSLFGNKEESSIREFGYLIPKPVMHEGISPLALAYSGSAYNKLTPDILIKEANLLIYDIATEIENPDEIVVRHTLEKFIILANTLRQLDEKHLAIVENDLCPPNENKERKHLCQKIFHDAIAQSGSGPALIVIRTWILTGKIKGMEAAQLVSRIPKTAREPTADYIKMFYDLIRSPEVKSQEFLNTTAPYAFSELIRYTMVWKQKSSYPVRTYGALISDKDKDDLIKIYIPYLTAELKKAYEEEDDQKILTYIVALANVAHEKIVPVLKPYLEGKYNLTTFQRTTMVNALRPLCTLKPELVRMITFKIYENTLENSEVRVAAVMMLLYSHPPLLMLQLIAQSTYYEPSQHVRNAIATGIISLAGLRSENCREIANNARFAMNFLNTRYPYTPSNKYSTYLTRDYVSEEKDFSAWFSQLSFFDKNTIIPDTLVINTGANFSSLSPPDSSLMYGVSDMLLLGRLLKSLFPSGDVKKPLEKSMVRDLADKLNILINEKKKLEGLTVLNNQYESYLFAFDEDVLLKVIDSIHKRIKDEHYERKWNQTYLKSWELLVIYPIEVGLPVNYRLEATTLGSLKADVEIKWRSHEKPIDLSLQLKADTVLSHKLTSRLSLAVPFNDKQYVCGNDMNIHLRLPANLRTFVDEKKKTLTFEYKPLEGVTHTKLFHHRTVPFTSIIDSVQFTPVQIDENTRRLILKPIMVETTKLAGFVLTSERDTFLPPIKLQPVSQTYSDYLEEFVTYMIQEQIYYKKTELTSNFKPKDNKISIVISYDYNDSYSREGEMIQRPEKLNLLLNEMKYKAKDPIDEFDLSPVSSHMLGIHVKVPSEEIHYYCDVGLLNLKTLWSKQLYSVCQFRSKDSMFKSCGVLDISRIPSVCPNLIEFGKKRNWFDAHISYGESCEESKARIRGVQKQSEELANAILDTEEYRRCKEEMKEGNIGMANCKKVCERLDIKDELHVMMKTDRKELDVLLHKAVQLFGNSIIPGAQVQFNQHLDQCSAHKSDVVDVKLKRLFDNGLLNLTVSASPMSLQATWNVYNLPVSMRQQMDSSMDVKDTALCTLDKTSITTFDNLIYPIYAMKCPYVLMISPESAQIDSNLDIVKKFMAASDRTQFAITAKDMENGDRHLHLILNTERFWVRVMEDGSLLINGEQIKFDGNKGLLPHDLLNVVEVERFPQNLYKIYIIPLDVNLYYNGKRVQIEAAYIYSGHMRGLCGNKDAIKENDLMAPRGCIMRNYEDFIATYIDDTNDTCPYEIKKKQEALLAECDYEEHRYTNIVIDQEKRRRNQSARPDYECSMWRTDVVTEEDRICFSTRPLRRCARGCDSDTIVTKNIAYHCQPKSVESLHMQRRIQMGANPDLSQRSVSVTKELQLPTDCRSL